MTSYVWRQTSDIGHIGYRKSDIRHQTSDILHRTSDIINRIWVVRHQKSVIGHFTSHIRHPYPCNFRFWKYFKPFLKFHSALDFLELILVQWCLWVSLRDFSGFWFFLLLIIVVAVNLVPFWILIVGVCSRWAHQPVGRIFEAWGLLTFSAFRMGAYSK